MALLRAQCAARRYVCVGLDAPWQRIPTSLIQRYDPGDPGSHPQYLFNIGIVVATCEVAGAYKLNIHSYLSQGPAGYHALINTVAFIKAQAPHAPVILDYRAAGLERVNEQIASVAFDMVGADAATFHPYDGFTEMARMVSARRNKGVVLICLSGNNELYTEELQNVEVALDDGLTFKTWEHVAFRADNYWGEAGNCCLEMPALYTDEIRRIRALADTLPLLITDGGLQDCDLPDAVRAGISHPAHLAMISTSFENVLERAEPNFVDLVRTEVAEMDRIIREALPF